MMKFDKVQKKWQSFSDLRKNKYISYKDVPINWYKNRKIQYSIIQIDELKKKYKKSQTLFILGSGPSLNQLNEEQWAHIKSHDSLGIGLSFLKKNHIPTFQQIEYTYDKSYRDYIVKAFNSETYRKDYQNVVFFSSSKVFWRFGHPRLIPEFYPENCICYTYELPDPIVIWGFDRPFRDDDFLNSLVYRGSMSHALELAVNHLNYKKIVLVGVDLDTYHYFYKEYPEMREYYEELLTPYFNSITAQSGTKKFDSMITKKGKPHSFDIYLYALSNYLKNKKNIDLYIWSMNNSLFPKLKAYFD